MKLTSALAAASALLSTTSMAATLHVANNGVDSTACGANAQPCRSISQAIANAQAGDTLLVRPGRYGDNDGSGFIDRLGEEFGGTQGGGTAGIRIAKRLTILSTEGAAATIIDMGNVTANAVEIVASGVRFGGKGNGFTITGAQTAGLSTGDVTNVVIGGNVAAGLPYGFLLASSGVVEARDNVAEHDTVGFLAMTWNPGGYVVVTNNVARFNGDGISVGSDYPHRIVGNQVLGNSNAGLGVNYGPSYIAQNVVTGNAVGVAVNGYSNDVTLPRGPLFMRNSFVGNERNGVDVYPGPTGILPVLRENNIFGNGNCGVTHMGATTLDARNNFWGAGTGPSFEEPADPTCAVTQPIRSTPFATSEFSIR